MGRVEFLLHVGSEFMVVGHDRLGVLQPHDLIKTNWAGPLLWKSMIILILCNVINWATSL